MGNGVSTKSKAQKVPPTAPKGPSDEPTTTTVPPAGVSPFSDWRKLSVKPSQPATDSGARASSDAQASPHGQASLDPAPSKPSASSSTNVGKSLGPESPSSGRIRRDSTKSARESRKGKGSAEPSSPVPNRLINEKRSGRRDGPNTPPTSTPIDTNNLYYLDSAGQIGSVRSPTAARKGKKKVRKTAAEQQYDWSLPDNLSD
eukprot:CAMPEP_0119541922 /NCGR_PEP_ID=MMETSP1344-20130328/53261_1 /TAXON_ID=236787 /ORGANISM="Florenciella parvula, Strain CCMP2471" /LENGTH=201 /DNA_ID=CAMNT_0007586025 /DNA_START=154 /DNA_END=759 /DNA_ORIENTATION=+